MLQTPLERDFVVQHWNDRDIYRKLLSHKLDPLAIDRLSIAQRHAKIYGYERKVQFEDTSVQQRSILALTHERDKVQETPAITVTDNMFQVITYLKNILKDQLVYSLPTAIFDAGAAAVGAVAPPSISEADLLDVLADRPLDGANGDACVYFQIVDSRPESKFKMRTAHLAKKKTEVRVKVLKYTGLTDHGDVRLGLQGDGRTLDVVNYCHLDKLKELMSELRLHTDEPHRMEMTFRPLLCDGTAAPILQPPRYVGVPDDAPLAALMDAPDVIAAAPDPCGVVALLPGASDTIAIRNNGIFSTAAVDLAKWLVAHKCWAENDHLVAPWDIPHAWSQDAETELIRWGVMVVSDDGFGGRTIALKLDATRIEGSIALVATHMASNRWQPFHGGKISKFGLELVFYGTTVRMHRSFSMRPYLPSFHPPTLELAHAYPKALQVAVTLICWAGGSSHSAILFPCPALPRACPTDSHGRWRNLLAMSHLIYII